MAGGGLGTWLSLALVSSCYLLQHTVPLRPRQCVGFVALLLCLYVSFPPGPKHMLYIYIHMYAKFHTWMISLVVELRMPLSCIATSSSSHNWGVGLLTSCSPVLLICVMTGLSRIAPMQPSPRVHRAARQSNFSLHNKLQSTHFLYVFSLVCFVCIFFNFFVCWSHCVNCTTFPQFVSISTFSHLISICNSYQCTLRCSIAIRVTCMLCVLGFILHLMGLVLLLTACSWHPIPCCCFVVVILMLWCV